MMIVLILAASGCCFNLRFLWALRRELRMEKLSPRVGERGDMVRPRKVGPRQSRPYLVKSQSKPQVRAPQEKPCETSYSLGSR
jgi:hypothetical protein